MTWKQFRFCLYCALLWPAAILIASRMHIYLGAAAWWIGAKSGATGDSLSQFQSDTALMQCMVFGFSLGCVPISRLREWLVASMAHWRHEPSANPRVELDPTRPLLWAWVLPSAVFLFRFASLLFQDTGRSVLATVDLPLIGTFRYFFTNSANFGRSGGSVMWVIDRFFVVQPMLFAAMYSAAVWLRHHRPMHEPFEPDEPESVPTDTLGS